MTASLLQHGLNNVKHKTLIIVLYSTGMRLSEIANLKIADIDSSLMQTNTYLVLLNMSAGLPKAEKNKLEKWLKVRLNQANLNPCCSKEAVNC